jgi:hypothetical protein
LAGRQLTNRIGFLINGSCNTDEAGLSGDGDLQIWFLKRKKKELQSSTVVYDI